MTTILGIVLLVLALVLLVIGGLAWSRKLPGNSVIGIRVAEVRKSRSTWDAAHELAGPLWVVAGVALAFGGLIAFRVSGWAWILPVIAVVVALGFIGAGANIGARRAAAIDVAEEYEKNNPQPSARPAPQVDMDALRRAADAADDPDQR